MIIVVTCYDGDPLTKKKTLVASHGIDSETDRVVILPCEEPSTLGAVWHQELREWVLYGEGEKPAADSLGERKSPSIIDFMKYFF